MQPNPSIERDRLSAAPHVKRSASAAIHAPQRQPIFPHRTACSGGLLRPLRLPRPRAAIRSHAQVFDTRPSEPHIPGRGKSRRPVSLQWRHSSLVSKRARPRCSFFFPCQSSRKVSLPETAVTPNPAVEREPPAAMPPPAPSLLR